MKHCEIVGACLESPSRNALADQSESHFLPSHFLCDEHVLSIADDSIVLNRKWLSSLPAGNFYSISIHEGIVEIVLFSILVGCEETSGNPFLQVCYERVMSQPYSL